MKTNFKIKLGIRAIMFGITVGIILMIGSIVIVNSTNFSDPAPKMPDADVDENSEEYQEYEKEYAQWLVDKANSDRQVASSYKSAMIVFDIGALLFTLTLLWSGIIGDVPNDLRRYFLLAGVIFLAIILSSTQGSFNNLWF